MITLPAWLRPNLVIKTAAAVAVMGFFDASYLTAKHFLGGPIPCSIFKGCDTVTNSVYASIFGIPVALLGAIFYLTWLILIIWYLDRGGEAIKKNLIWLGSAGFLFSIYFVGVQALVIKAFCLYCLISALTSTLLFILSLILRFRP